MTRGEGTALALGGAALVTGVVIAFRGRGTTLGAGPKRGIGPGTVENFHRVLISKITQYDQREGLRDMKRGGRVNIYRLGHLLKAAQEAESAVTGIKTRSDAEALAEYRRVLDRHFTPGFSPVMNVEKQMSTWIAEGKSPSLLGQLGMNIRRKVRSYPVPPVCTARWNEEDWERTARHLDPAPRRECAGFVYVYDPAATKREGQIMYRQAGRARR